MCRPLNKCRSGRPPLAPPYHYATGQADTVIRPGHLCSNISVLPWNKAEIRGNYTHSYVFRIRDIPAVMGTNVTRKYKTKYFDKCFT